MEMTALCRSVIYRLQESGDFPRSVTVGKRNARWYEHEVQAWLAAQVDERKPPAPSATTSVTNADGWTRVAHKADAQ
jgi:prophage regulatory protein